jgi:hypothetical protein
MLGSVYFTQRLGVILNALTRTALNGGRELPKHKSRPDNNFHCFEGIGLSYWRALAQGLSPAKGRSPDPNLHQGPDGARWEFKQDIDGYVAQNGGMSNPQEIKLSPATYFRFFGTIVHNTKGAKGGDERRLVDRLREYRKGE